MGAAEITVIDPLTVADYLVNFATFWNIRSFGEIEDGHGDLALFDACGEERRTSNRDWVKR